MAKADIVCLYTRYFLRCIHAHMSINKLVMYIDTSNTLWHIDDFKDGEFLPETLQAQE